MISVFSVMFVPFVWCNFAPALHMLRSRLLSASLRAHLEHACLRADQFKSKLIASCCASPQREIKLREARRVKEEEEEEKIWNRKQQS